VDVDVYFIRSAYREKSLSLIIVRRGGMHAMDFTVGWMDGCNSWIWKEGRKEGGLELRLDGRKEGKGRREGSNQAVGVVVVQRTE
jgi:hypothetical protein